MVKLRFHLQEQCSETEVTKQYLEYGPTFASKCLREITHSAVCVVYLLYIHTEMVWGMYSTTFKMALGRRRPWWLSSEASACQCRRHGFNPWFRKTPDAEKQLSLEPQPLSLCSRGWKPQPLKPKCPGAHVLQQEEPLGLS